MQFQLDGEAATTEDVSPAAPLLTWTRTGLGPGAHLALAPLLAPLLARCRSEGR